MFLDYSQSHAFTVNYSFVLLLFPIIILADSLAYRDAYLRHLGFRESYVKLQRTDIDPEKPKRNLLSTIIAKPARSHVLWLPSISVTKPNSYAAIGALATYQQNQVKAPVPGTSCTANEKNTSMDDFHAELMAKLSAPKYGLKNASERKLAEPKPGEIPQWLQIFEQYQAVKEQKNDPFKF